MTMQSPSAPREAANRPEETAEAVQSLPMIGASGAHPGARTHAIWALAAAAKYR